MDNPNGFGIDAAAVTLQDAKDKAGRLGLQLSFVENTLCLSRIPGEVVVIFRDIHDLLMWVLGDRRGVRSPNFTDAFEARAYLDN